MAWGCPQCDADGDNLRFWPGIGYCCQSCWAYLNGYYRAVVGYSPGGGGGRHCDDCGCLIWRDEAVMFLPSGVYCCLCSKKWVATICKKEKRDKPIKVCWSKEGF